jgi:hypothetical protein
MAKTVIFVKAPLADSASMIHYAAKRRQSEEEFLVSLPMSDAGVAGLPG